MAKIGDLMLAHYSRTSAEHGATPRGVDWNRLEDVHIRYSKMLEVLRTDFLQLPGRPSLLDVGCGWGGLLEYAHSTGMSLDYTGIDIVKAMIEYGRSRFTEATFILGDILETNIVQGPFDFVVCNGILTLKPSVTIPEMERFAKHLIRTMFDLCRHGMAFNMMSTRVNFMVDNLYYQNPVEILSWLLSEISPRVRLDHSYSSLGSGKRRLYEFTAYAFKD
jgi:2-polyprenyl-3-methyl-5-hydroxy-6-metoxy-1,4-benzoquinol methylase